MAYVAPHGIIELYQSVPLTPSYEHTLWFASDADQRAYFSARTFMTFNNQMYTRVHGNKVRIHANAETVNRCSYLGFKNDLKWYYAFIIQCEYINEQVTEITYQLDHIQTWFRSITLKACFIERQHSTSDAIGDNVQPEPITSNEHIAIQDLISPYNYYDIGYVMSVGIVTAVSGDLSNDPLFSSSEFGGLGSTIRFLYFSSPSDINVFLKAVDFANGAFEVVGLGFCQPMSLYAVPANIFKSAGNDYRIIQIGSRQLSVKILPQYANEVGSGYLPAPTKLGEPPHYVPKNKKLLTYPYSFIRASFPTGSQDYKFENFFLNGESAFRIYATCNPVPAIVIVPVIYELDSDQYHYSITLDTFPQIAVYQDGVGSAAGQLIAQTLKTSIVAGAGMLAGGIASGAATEAVDSMAGKYGVSNTALVPVSAYSNENARNSIGIKNFMGAHGNNPDDNYASDYSAGLVVPNISTHPNIKSSGGASELAPIMAKKWRDGAVDNKPLFNISFQQFGLRLEVAKKFDEFFSKYGYAQNTVAIPNIHARSGYTYVKTRGCNVGGPVPAEAMRCFNRAMDNGITWWASYDVCQYKDANGDLRPNNIL